MEKPVEKERQPSGFGPRDLPPFLLLAAIVGGIVVMAWIGFTSAW